MLCHSNYCKALALPGIPAGLPVTARAIDIPKLKTHASSASRFWRGCNRLFNSINILISQSEVGSSGTDAQGFIIVVLCQVRLLSHLPHLSRLLTGKIMAETRPGR